MARFIGLFAKLITMVINQICIMLGVGKAQKKSIFYFRRLQSGSMLIELLVAIGIVVMAAGLLVMQGNFFQKVAVRASLDELYATSHYLRMKALVTGLPETITFVPEQGCYYWQNGKVTLPQGVHYGTIAGVYGPPAFPSRPVYKSVTFNKNVLSFSETGILSSGTVYLRSASSTYGYALTSGVAACSYLRRYYFDTAWHLVN